MALKEGTQLSEIMWSSDEKVKAIDRREIIVGKESGPMGWFATAEVYWKGKLQFVAPLHMLESYEVKTFPPQPE